MYVKVHKEGNQWFRDNNGTLLGEDCFGEIFTDYPYVKINDTKVHIFKGYLDENGLFIPFCPVKPELCNNSCVLKHQINKASKICPFVHSENPTSGFYADIPYHLI